MAAIYNTTDGPLVVDREGRVLGSRDHADGVDVTAEPVAGHIAAGRLIVTSADPELETTARAKRGKTTNQEG